MSRRVEVLAWVLSLALHGSVGAYVFWSTTAPDVGFDFTLPMEVEFGLTEAVEVSAGASQPAAPPESAAAPSEEGEGPGAELDGGVPEDAGPADAGPPDAGRERRRRDAGPPEEVAAADEGECSGDEPGEGRGVAFLPAGSQIALRLDVARIRRSPLGPDVRSLLAAMPDWQALLPGSGTDPLEDLDRLLVATPNLQRSRLIVAGRANAGPEAIRAAAERLAANAGETLTWRTEHGVQLARWYNQDETQRVVAIIGPRHFLLCRPQDVARVMAVARNRGAEEEAHPADALLSMQEGEGLSLEVEGARNFAQARGRSRSPLEMLPTEVRLALSELPEDQVAARSRFTYEDEDGAATAAEYWDRMRAAYSRNVITAVLGLAPVLQRATIEADGDHFEGSVDLQASEMRRLLALVRGYFEDRARARQRGSAPPSPAAPTAPAPPPDNPYE